MTTKPSIYTGDVVRRTGGENKMTVSNIEGNKVWCVWFVGDKLYGGGFDKRDLELAESAISRARLEFTKGGVRCLADQLRTEFKQRLTSTAQEYSFQLLEGHTDNTSLDMMLRCRVALQTAARISNEVVGCLYETGDDVDTMAVQLEDARRSVLPHARPEWNPVFRARHAMQDLAQRQVDEVMGAALVKCEGTKPTGEDLLHWRALTDAERKTLTDWADNGWRHPYPNVRSRAECLGVPIKVTATVEFKKDNVDVHTTVDPKHVEPMPTLDELVQNGKVMGEVARRHTDAIAAELAKKAPQTGLRLKGAELFIGDKSMGMLRDFQYSITSK